MKRIVTWIWQRGVVSTFMTGLFVILPIVITIAIMSWAGGIVVDVVGSESFVGRRLKSLGMTLLHDEAHDWIGMLLGWSIIITCIWLIGVLVKTLARQRLETMFNYAIDRIPIVSSVYKPVSQVVNMLKQDDSEDMKSMAVVYCSFGEANGGGFLALLTSPQSFRFAEQDCYAVYIPTSPVPMSGGIVFVPVAKVLEMDMQVDDLMQIYFSLGVMASKVVPDTYQTKKQETGAEPQGPTFHRP